MKIYMDRSEGSEGHEKAVPQKTEEDYSVGMLSHDGALAPVVVRRSTRLSNREPSGERSMSQQCTACSERPKTVNQDCAHRGRHAVQSENSSINTPCYFPGNTTRKALSEIIGIKKCCTVNELDQATQFLGGKSDLDRGTTMALRSKTQKNLSLSRVNRRNRFGETLLHLAVMDEDTHLVREILKIGACPSEADYAGWTPLHVAAAASHYDIVVTLLEAGAVVNFSGDKGVTPLHDAIESGNYKIVELLLSSGADPLQKTDDGRSALDMTMDAALRKLIERYQPKANQSSPGQCELRKWCCQDGSKVAKSALNSDAKASSCSGGFSPKRIACNKNQESFGVEALLKCRDSITAEDKDAVLSKPAIVFNKARNGQVIVEGTEEDGQDSDSTPAITADNEKEHSELSLSQNNESIIMCTEDLLGNLRNSDGNLVADGGEQFIHQISEDKAQECPESFTAYLEEATACCRVRNQMKEQNDLQTNFDLEQHKDGKNETVRCDLNIKQNFGCQTAKPIRNPKIDPEDDVNENMDECSISLLCPYARDSDLPCAPKAWHRLNAGEGERLSTASNSTPSIKGSSSFSDGSTPSLLLEQSRSYDGISASDSCKTSTAELPVLQHEVASFGEKYDIALSGRNSESIEIKKQSAEPLIACENKKNSTEVNQTLLEQQDNNRCEPTECMEHIEMAEMIRLLSDSELSNLSNPETPYPEKDALICVPVNVENFCSSLEDDCGALLALRGSGSCSSRALSQEKGCDITKWLLDSNTQVGSPKAVECVDLICQTIEDISQGAIEKAGLQCGQELLNQQALSCQSEFHISGQVSENVVYDNSGSVSKKGLLESENNLSPHVVMSASENLLHNFSCSSQPVYHDTQNDDENCSFDSDCTYVSESYFLKGTETENLNNDSLNSGTRQDSSNKNFKRHSKKHHDKFDKGSDQQQGKLLQDNVSNVDSIYIREDCDPTNQSANILKNLPSGSDSINPVPCSGHQVQLRRKSAPQRTCCMDYLTEVLPSKKRRSSKKFQSTSSALDKVKKKQDEMLAMDLTDPKDTGKFTEAFAQIQTLLSDVLNKHKAENENLTRKYRIASDSFKHGTLREQVSSLSSRQKCLLDILQRQNNLRVRFQMFHNRSFESQTTAEAPWTSMNVCDAETIHKTQWRDCRTGTLEQLSEDNCSGLSSALSLCSEAVSQNCSDQTQVTLGISYAGPQFSVNELRTDSCTFFDSFVNVDNQAGVPPSFTVQASPVAVHTENIQSQIKVPSELAYLIKQGTIKPGENVFRLKLKGNCHTASLQENGSIKDTGGQVYISPEQWIGSLLGPSVPMSPTYAWKKVTYRSKPLLGYVRKAGPVAVDSTASLQNRPSKATPPGDLLKEVCTESPIGDLMKIQTILLVSDSEFMNNYELDQHWNRLLESDDWTI